MGAVSAEMKLAHHTVYICFVVESGIILRSLTYICYHSLLFFLIGSCVKQHVFNILARSLALSSLAAAAAPKGYGGAQEYSVPSV